VPFALAADRVLARENIVLNPYYQHMGGLYGSEYWTYLLPRRLGTAVAGELTSAPFTPVSARRAVRIGLVDDAFGASAEQFTAAVHRSAAQLAQSPLLPELLALKRRQRDRDERAKPLLGYRHEELARSHECFFGPDKRYHHARTRFTHKQPGALAPS
jgi:putative two-component system hydrogenase maturation factor HypX/HoxX